MSDSVSARGYAKINLFLRIVGAKGDYHEIETLLQSVDLYDEITLSKTDNDTVTSSFPGDNSILVLETLKDAFHLGGMTLSVKKNIPLGGGLGGSSADAAAAAVACAKLWDLPLEIVKKTVASLYGDLAFQMTAGTAIARGMGEEIDSLPPLPDYAVLLAFPKEGVSTEEAYRLSDTLPKGRGSALSLYWALTRGDDANRYYLNDLLPPAILLNDEISPFLERMRDDKALLTGMTGSGSTLFSLYKRREDAIKKSNELPFSTLVTETISPFLAK